MGHSERTRNYRLPIFIGRDKPSWLSDVNHTNEQIDNILSEMNQRMSDMQNQIINLQERGN